MFTTMKSRLAVAAVSAAVIPLGFSSPAQAGTWHDGCWVEPQLPSFAGTFTAGNVPEVFYEYDLVCLPGNAAMSVEVKTETWEQDLLGRAGDIDSDGVNHADEDRIGGLTTNRGFGTLGGGATVKVKGVLPHTDTDANEEVYHKVKFRVTSGFVTGAWSSFELSQPTRIWW